MKIDTLAHVKNQLSSVVEQLGAEPLFITRNGRITAVLQSLSDDEVEDYLFRNSRKFWRLLETRREQARQGETLAFDPARYEHDGVGKERAAARERGAQYNTPRKARKRKG
jgi:PHD/YefM family antitoxin component YafN of YafNO toxin-antitoxin module